MGKTDCGTSLGEAMITDLDFSVDFLIFGETLEFLMGALDTLSAESEPLGLNVSLIKIKIQKFVASSDENIDISPQVSQQGDHISFVDNFLYLEIAIGSGVRSFPEINRGKEFRPP